MKDARWLAEEFCARLAAVYESMAGEAPELQVQPLAELPAVANVYWRQTFSGIDGFVSIAASEADWTAAARPILHATGADEGDQARFKSTYFEILARALEGIAQALRVRLRREIACSERDESTSPVEALWTPVSFRIGAEHGTLWIAGDALFSSALMPPADAESQSRTFDLLLEVELPVSVSFGRAQVALKDVLKLTTGSIVELNRAVADPVEVIVNNCVIARGEVVVIEGNFGVRIQQVISRSERLRTLN
jgi:flagellar motor switch protein FliN/FliY